MFYQGDLQSGIAKALQERKVVGCLVHDNDAQSREWEESWLTDATLEPLLQQNAVLLRLAQDSPEAGFLSAFSAIPSVPCMLMINNGQVRAKLTADLEEADFKELLKDALAITDVVPGAVPAATHPMPLPVEPAAALPAAEASDSHDEGLTMNDRVRNTLSERRQRLEAERQRQQATEKAERKARAEARKAEEGAGPARSAQANQASQVKKAQQEAREERERILQKIENDKQERRQRAQHRRAQSGSESNPPVPASALSSRHQRSGSNIKECALQVRLFDGSTVRQRFSAWKTIRTHVRPWIEQQRNNDDTPYTFRQILVPLPNRMIEISEEDEDLETLGLCPSATLIMVPVKEFANAYDQQSSYVAKGVSTGYNIVSEGVGMIGGAIGSLFGYGTPRQSHDLPAESSESSTRTRGSEEDHHLYTGNGINVEPRVELKREDSWG